MKPFKTILAATSAVALVLGLTTVGLAGAAHADDHSSAMQHGAMHVTKSPSCGCCGAWVAMARQEGYEVEVTDTADVTTVKLDSKIPGDLWACHTAIVQGYVIEGHMPFAALEKLLAEQPDVSGISVPGMPAGSPGMGNDPSASYDVIAFGGSAGAGEVYFQVGQ